MCFVFALLSTMMVIGSYAAGRGRQEIEDCSLVDLTWPFNNETIYWPTSSSFNHSNIVAANFDYYYYEAWRYQADEHGGTHMDAPVHFAEGQLPLNQLPLSQLVGELCLIDVEEDVIENGPDYRIPLETVLNWETSFGSLKNCIVVFRTGYGKRWPNFEAYMGTPLEDNRTEVAANLHFPGIAVEACEHLAEVGVKGVGLDTASLDYGQSTKFECHQNLANLEQIQLSRSSPRGCTIIALPMKIEDGSGGPLRVVAYGCNGRYDACRRQGAVWNPNPGKNRPWSRWLRKLRN